ncbi:MAG: hypothetical protein ACYCOU_04285 [Sulfobacillus sp.]
MMNALPTDPESGGNRTEPHRRPFRCRQINAVLINAGLGMTFLSALCIYGMVWSTTPSMVIQSTATACEFVNGTAIGARIIGNSDCYYAAVCAHATYQQIESHCDRDGAYLDVVVCPSPFSKYGIIGYSYDLYQLCDLPAIPLYVLFFSGIGAGMSIGGLCGLLAYCYFRACR